MLLSGFWWFLEARGALGLMAASLPLLWAHPASLVCLHKGFMQDTSLLIEVVPKSLRFSIDLILTWCICKILMSNKIKF